MAKVGYSCHYCKAQGEDKFQRYHMKVSFERPYKTSRNVCEKVYFKRANLSYSMLKFYVKFAMPYINVEST